MISAGYSESVTFGFTSPKRIEYLNLDASDIRTKPIVIDNPMTIEQSVMRTSLIPNLLGALSNNIKHGTKDVALFEVGSVFLRQQGQGELPKEPTHLAGLLSGAKPGWLTRENEVDVFDVKGTLELVFFELLNGQSPMFESSQDEAWLHPGIAAKVSVGDVVVGYLGEIHPDVREKFEISQSVFGFEISLDKLPHLEHRSMSVIPKYPAIVRDVSMLIDVDIPSSKVSQTIDNIDEKLLVEAHVLEDYRDPEHVPKGKKGMLWSLTYRSLERTLTDKEVDKAHQVIETKVIETLGGTRR